jgi:type II secretion system protein H
MSPTGKSHRGFTLIELMVLVVIMGIVSAMAIPNLSRSLANASLRAAARDLMTATQYARNYAVTHQTQTRLLLDTENNRYMLLARRTDDDGQSQFAQMTLAMTGTRELGRGVKFGEVEIQPSTADEAPSDDGESQVNFDPLGQADAAVIQLVNDRHMWTLYVAPSTGRLTLTEGDQAPPPQDRQDLDLDV